MTQRYMATGSTAQANKSVWIAILGYIPLGFLFFFLGTALFVFYTRNPDPGITALANYAGGAKWDAVYPYFVVTQFPVGVAGLVIAAICAASMSSVDSLMNSSSTVCIEDFYKRFGKKERSERHYLNVARALTLVWGAAAIGAALLCMKVDSVQVAWNKIMAFSTNGVLALMALAFLPIRIRAWAAIGGFVIGGIVLYIARGTSVNFLLYAVIGNVACFVAAIVLEFGASCCKFLSQFSEWQVGERERFHGPEDAPVEHDKTVDDDSAAAG